MEKNGYGHMVLDYYVERLRAMRAERHERLSKLKTKEDAIAYQQYVRGVVDKAFGPWPERVPLDIQYGETLQRDGYRIEKVSFNSRPKKAERMKVRATLESSMIRIWGFAPLRGPPCVLR